jgi:hypothetical protein
LAGIDDLFEGSGHPGLAELRSAVHEVLGAPATISWVSLQKLTCDADHFTYRLHFEVNGAARRLIIKRLAPDIGQRNQLLVTRWLPAVGLSDSGPPLLAVAAARGGECVWHVLEDRGNCSLSGADADSEPVRAAVEAIAEIHARFASHALLAECRAAGGSFGASYYAASVRDAIGALQSLRPPLIELSVERRALRERLLERLYGLLDQESARARAVVELGGPETLLHGDLVPANVLVFPTDDTLSVRFIDWDHVGVGPVSYDLSTFLSRFPAPQRRRILHVYEHALARHDWRLPSAAHLNQLFDTAQWARLSQCVIWPAIAVRDGHTEWAFQQLASVEHWFEAWEPLLP